MGLLNRYWRVLLVGVLLAAHPAVRRGESSQTHVPASGSTTNSGSFSLDEDSSITWLWAIQDLVLSNQVVNTTTNYTATGSIALGNGYQVDPPGNVMLEAGEEIRLKHGCHVQTGGSIRAKVDL